MLPQAPSNVLFDQSPLPSWIFDIATLRFLAVNRAAIERYGYTREEFLAMTLADIRPQQDVPILLENTASHHEPSQDSRTWKHKHKDGSILFVRIVSRAIHYAGCSARLVAAVDIQEQTMAEQALASSESLLQRVWDNAHDCMRLTDSNGIVTRVNHAYCRFTGLPNERLENRPYWIIYPDKEHPKSRARYLERFRNGRL